MKKEDTIKQYIDQFLSKRSEEARSEFLSRSVDKQYAAIMAWKHRQYSSNSEMTDAESIVDALRVIRRCMPSIEGLEAKDLRKIRKELMLVETSLEAYEKQQREKEIKELEAQQNEIVRRLAELKKQ